MNLLHAIILGIIEGVTEFLPISSTGHLTIAEKLMGYQIDSSAITAFTAVIQIGAIVAAIIYFRSDIIRVATAWVLGLFNAKKRHDTSYRLGWYVIIGTIPVAVVGLVFHDSVETVFRSLWFVVAGLLVWSVVLWIGDRYEARLAAHKDEESLTWRDALTIGIAQCVALIPGVSRSGATISAGLLRGISRVEATRLSFFLGIPALMAAGLLESVTKAGHISDSVGWTPTIVATIVSFVVGYITIAWLLRFVSNHNFSLFIWYRVILGAGISILLLTGTIGAV